MKRQSIILFAKKLFKLPMRCKTLLSGEVWYCHTHTHTITTLCWIRTSEHFSKTSNCPLYVLLYEEMEMNFSGSTLIQTVWQTLCEGKTNYSSQVANTFTWRTHQRNKGTSLCAKHADGPLNHGGKGRNVFVCDGVCGPMDGCLLMNRDTGTDKMRIL